MSTEQNSLPGDQGEHIGAGKKDLWFEALLQNIPEGILIAEAGEVNVLVISEYGLKLLALPSEEVLHHTFRSLLDRVVFYQPDGKTEVPYEEHPLIRALQRGDSAEDDEYVLRNASDEVYTVSSKYGPIYSESGEIVAGIFSWMNISQRKQMELDLEETTRRLESSNQALEAFSASAAHDLQEPLRKVVGFSNMLQSEYAEALGSSGQDLLARMRNAAQRMQTMINNLLSYSRITTRPVEFQQVDLQAVIQNVLSELEASIQNSGAQVEVDPLPAISSDPLLMEHVFQNLIENAIKFRKSSTVPTIRIYQEKSGPDGSGWVRIAVEDNGIGFDMANHDRIFQPFQRLHGRNAYEGTGLGLSIAMKIVEQHGGQITASSQPGVGSTFYLDLPSTSPS